MPNTKLSSLPTIRRLPSYLLVVEAAANEGKEYISGTVIAEELELEPIQVRKDLSLTGVIGKPRLGFPVQKLVEAINRFLDWHQSHRAVVVGAGNLGTALMGYPEFRRHGMNILAAFDTQHERIGKEINGVPVFALDNLSEKVRELEVEMALLTVPSTVAQETADQLIAAGVRAIWNFTNIKLKVPRDVLVQKEDLSSGYAMLSVKMARAKTVSRNR